MLKISPEVFLSWPLPNYVDPVRRGPELWIASAVSLFVALSAVTLRLYARIFLRRWVGVDDWLIVVAMVLFIGVFAIVALGNIRFAWDVHIWDMPISVAFDAAKALYAVRIIWVLASCSVRLSVLCLFYRLLHLCRGAQYRWLLHVVTALTICHGLAFSLAMAFSCTPVTGYWRPVAGTQCIDEAALMLSSAALNTFQEFLVASLPVFAVFRFRVVVSQRWSVIGLLSLGYLVGVAGCVRVYYVWKALSTVDVTWWSGPHWICSEVELATAVTCASSPPLRLALSHIYNFLRRALGLSARPPSVPKKDGGLSSPSSTSTSATTKSRTKATTTITESTECKSWDPEADGSRTTTMTCSIDIEGIHGAGGSGYTVTICGPKTPLLASVEEEARRRGFWWANW